MSPISIPAFNRPGLILGLLLLIVLGGCTTTNTLYYWGDYEQIIYNMYQKPGSEPPGRQIEKLQATIKKAYAINRPVAPGIYAHLGFMYAMMGSKTEAELAFKEEKRLFPESSTMLDGMMERAAKMAEKNTSNI